MSRALLRSPRRALIGTLSLAAAVAAIVLPTSPASATAAPTISIVAPTAISVEGGSTVVKGTAFIDVTEVEIDGVAATFFMVETDRRIALVAPAHAAGAVDITVTTASGTFTAPAALTYVEAPTITAISAESGTWRGGETVTITGTNLATTRFVTFGQHRAHDITVVSDTQVDVSTPTGWGRYLDISVDTPGGIATQTEAWTYISPATGPQHLRVTDKGVRSLTIAWDRPELIGGSTLRGYVVQWRLANVRDWLGRALDPDARGATLRNLTPGAVYIVRVAAVTGERGGFSITGAKVPGARPTN